MHRQILSMLARCTAPLLVVLAACSLQTNAPVPTPPATLETVTAESVTNVPPLSLYESPRFGYSFRYPVTSSIEVSGEGELVWIDQQILIQVLNTDPEQARGDAPVIESAESTVVNGSPARRLSGYIGAVGGNTPQRYLSIVIPSQNRFYSVTAYELRRDVLLPPDRTMGDIPPSILTVYDTLLGTFTFSS